MWAGLMVCRAASASSRAGLAASNFPSAIPLADCHNTHTHTQSVETLTDQAAAGKISAMGLVISYRARLYCTTFRIKI